MIQSELASASADVSPQAVMPWPPRMQPIASGCCSLIAAMSRPSWKPGRRHGTQTTLSPKISLVSFSPSAAVAIAMPESGCRWSTCAASTSPCMAVSIDGRGAALAVQAVVERGDHLVLALDAGVDVDQRAHPVEPEHREAGLRQGAEVAAGALDPEQLDVLAGHRVGLDALGGGVAAGVVGVPRVRAEPVRPLDELGDGGVDGVVRHGQFHPAWWPPTRSASICSW